MFTSLVITLVLLELFGRIINPENQANNKKCIDCQYRFEDPELGVWPKSKLKKNPKFYCSPDNLCFETEYTFDKYGRREIISTQDYKKHILLFGCSIVFGNGIRDNQTLGALLQKRKIARVYSYALGSSGAPLPLRLLETGKIEKEVPEIKGAAFFFLANFHKYRQTINSYHSWRWFRPSYELNPQNQLVSSGFQADNEGFRLYLYKAFLYVQSKSRFLSYFRFIFNSHTEEENIHLMAKTLARAKKIYEEQFDGKFYVVGHPSHLPYPETIEALKKEGLDYITLPALPRNPKKYALCECDQHPNVQANKEIENSFYSWLRKNKMN